MKSSGPRTAVSAASSITLVGLIIFWGAAQGCGTNEARPYFVDVDAAPGGCPGVPCAAGLECVGGECIVIDGCFDPDGDGYGPGCELGDDCEPDDPDRSPGAVEVCNDIDDDCDFIVDEDRVCAPCVPTCEPGEAECAGARIVRCDDSSGCADWASPAACPGGLSCFDGACVETCQDADGDGFFVDCPGERTDCDDDDPSTYPRAPELCDGRDNNCDGTVDELGVCDVGCEDECAGGEVACATSGDAVITCERGADGCLRFGPPRSCGVASSCVEGRCTDTPVCVDLDGDGAGPNCGRDDCRPSDPSAYEGAPEECDGVDDDCDGVIDDGGVCTTCTSGSEAFPEGLPRSGVVERVACGGPEYFTWIGPPPRDLAVVVSGDRAVSLALGSYGSTGRFTPVVEGWRLGAMVGATSSAALGGIRVTAPAGTRYALAATAEAATCTPDAWEPNNAPASATPLGTGATALAATLCAGETDFYAVDVAPGQVIAAAASFDEDSGGDVLLRVWRNGVEVGASGAGPFEGGFPRGRHAHFRADLPGSYVVGARGRNASATSAYAFAVRTLDIACADDARETTDGLDDDTIETSRRLAGGASTNAVLCPGDVDVLDLGAFRSGQTYSATFRILSGDTGVDFLVVRDSLRSVFHDGSSDETESTFSSNVSTAGRYYALIYGRTPTATARYEYSHSVR